MRRSSYYTGPVGACEDCSAKTFIRLGAITQEVTEKSWSPCKQLVTAIYKSIHTTLVPPGGKYVEEYYFHKDEQSRQYVRLPRWKKADEPTAVCPTCKLKASTLLWVDVAGVIGGPPDDLDGPFCGRCFSRYKRRFESDEGVGAALPVYYVTVNLKRILTIDSMFEDGWGTETTEAPEHEEGEQPTDEVDGLF